MEAITKDFKLKADQVDKILIIPAEYAGASDYPLYDPIISVYHTPFKGDSLDLNIKFSYKQGTVVRERFVNYPIKYVDIAPLIDVTVYADIMLNSVDLMEGLINLVDEIVLNIPWLKDKIEEV